MRRGTRISIIGGVILLLLLIVIFAALFFIDEPLRRRMQADMNRSLKGYRVELPELDLNPVGFSVILRGLTVIQEAHPDPPVARFDRLRASVHWRALLKRRLVADFRLDNPDIHVNLIQLQKEASEKVPVEDRGWQGAVRAIYPLKVNLLTVRGGRFTYIDKDSKRPMQLSDIRLDARNIRNVFSPEQVYPSPFHFTARVFDRGKAVIGGKADFLAEPHPAVEAELEVEEVDLGYFEPVLAKAHLHVTGGVFGARGRMEYTPEIKTAHLKTVSAKNVKMDYIHSARTAAAEKRKVEKTRRSAKEAVDKPGLFLRIDDLLLTGEVGFVNRAQNPDYRLFLSRADLRLANLSNRFLQGPAEARLKGFFMGSGRTDIIGRFRPEKDGPDFDLFLRIVGTEMTAMNNLLRAHGKVDVTEGRFSLFTEIHVQDGRIEGYVKPFFKDLDVYDPAQDEEKSLFRKLREGLLEGISKLLKNEATDRVATRADISGKVDDPETSTWQIIGNMIENAFFKIIMPGFDEQSTTAQEKE